jgi:hypothetical protein
VHAHRQHCQLARRRLYVLSSRGPAPALTAATANTATAVITAASAAFDLGREPPRLVEGQGGHCSQNAPQAVLVVARVLGLLRGLGAGDVDPTLA